MKRNGGLGQQSTLPVSIVLFGEIKDIETFGDGNMSEGAGARGGRVREIAV